MKEELKQKELWTQKEVADYFRVVPGTICNWREQGYLKHFQAPGSTRVLFYRDDIISFRNHNTKNGKGGGATEKLTEIEKEKPVVSPNQKDEDWRI